MPARNCRPFAERANIPVAFTLHGLSAMPVDHPVSLGMVGMHGTVEANRALMHADLIISFGMRFDDRVTGNLKDFARDAKVIHVEIDPSEIDKNVKTSVSLNADVAQVLTLLERDPALVFRPRSRWFAQIDTLPPGNCRPDQSGDRCGNRPGGAVAGQDHYQPSVSPDAGKGYRCGRCRSAPDDSGPLLQFPDRQQLVYFRRCRNHGMRPAHGHRREAGRPDERVWSVSGDGGFQMNIQELGTIMEHDIDVKILLMNNGYLGMVRQWQTLFYDGRYAGTPMKNPDYGAIAGAYGIPYLKVSELDQVDEAIQRAAGPQGAFMIEFLCDPSEIILPMVPAGGGVADMIVSID
jgi:acetolactate synthase-1/2/3 large subunit